MAAATILISKTDLTAVHPEATALAPLREGQARLRIDSLAITANTVTYAVAGDAFGYWKFFPAPDGFGIAPAWGFGIVEESRADALKPGERIYGYFPLASHLTVDVARADALGFSDGALHRQGLSPIYNRYIRTSADPGYRAADEPLIAAFRPLFTTAFLIDAMLEKAGDFGAAQLVVSSASSKTSYGLAFLAKQRGLAVAGLTGAGNRAFVNGLGFFGRVLAYDEISMLDRGAPSAFIDMAGDTAVTHAVHDHFGDMLKHSATVGMTHWTVPRTGAAPTGVAPTLFFAPDHAVALTKAWGAEAFQARLGAAFAGLAAAVRAHLQVRRVSGAQQTAQAFAETARGQINPREILLVQV